MVDFAVPGLMPLEAPKWDAAPAFILLASHNASTTLWQGISDIGPITFNGETPATPAARVILEFVPQFKPETQCIIFDTDEGADGIVVFETDGAALWYFSVPEQPLPLSVGVWDWNIRVIDADDHSWKLYQGKITILP